MWSSICSLASSSSASCTALSTAFILVDICLWSSSSNCCCSLNSSSSSSSLSSSSIISSCCTAVMVTSCCSRLETLHPAVNLPNADWVTTWAIEEEILPHLEYEPPISGGLMVVVVVVSSPMFVFISSLLVSSPPPSLPLPLPKSCIAPVSLFLLLCPLFLKLVVEE